jgi:hypothetical protein
MFLAADGDAAVVVGKDGIARAELNNEAAVWVPWPSKSDGFWGQHSLLVGTNLFVGSDAGEFGGELNRIDIRTGESDKVFLDTEPRLKLFGQGLPIKSLVMRPDGKIWILEGLGHLTLREGRLHQLSDGICSLFCSSCDSQLVNWKLPPAIFKSLAFDSQGRPIVLTADFGLVRYENGAWTRLNPDWPGLLPVNKLLMSSDDEALIGAYRAGVVVLNLRSGRARRVIISEE